MVNIRRSSFYPVSGLEGKSNFKRFIRIERDGSAIERVFLNVPDSSSRELLICMHYFRHICRHFLGEDMGVNILNRDCPWDFSLEFSSGAVLNLEITSISDMRQHFEINKNEERLFKWISEEIIPLHELEKINRLFPDQKLDELVGFYKKSGISIDDLVENPLFGSRSFIFLSSMPETDNSLEKLIRDAISKKVSKNHPNKDETVLIIDNRTSLYEVSDYKISVEALSGYFESIPFPEIWFYTGYCSDDDGNNAEFSFAPLKITNYQQKVLKEMACKNKIDENGRIVW